MIERFSENMLFLLIGMNASKSFKMLQSIIGTETAISVIASVYIFFAIFVLWNSEILRRLTPWAQ